MNFSAAFVADPFHGRVIFHCTTTVVYSSVLLLRKLRQCRVSSDNNAATSLLHLLFVLTAASGSGKCRMENRAERKARAQGPHHGGPWSSAQSPHIRVISGS